MDSRGKLIVTGQGIGEEGTWNALTIKYSPAGQRLWIQRHNEGIDDRAAAIAVDRWDNIYIAGATDFDYATVKYSPAGRRLWWARYDGPVHGADHANAIVVDRLGNAYVTGHSTYLRIAEEDEAGGLLTLKYSPNGAQRWAARYNLPDEALSITPVWLLTLWVTFMPLPFQARIRS